MAVCRDGVRIAYRYRSNGLRYGKTIRERDGKTASIVHLWDGQNIVVEIGATGTVTARYLRGINLIAREQDGANQYYLFNAHGDVTKRADAWGNILKNYRYDAFGNEQSPEKLDSNPFRYCGEYFDQETGEIYLRARYYNPAIGRFGAEDSVKSTSYQFPNEQEITDPLSLNLYTYGSNNPVLYVDNSGNFAVLAVAAIALGIGMIADIASGSAYVRYSAMAQDPNWYTVGNWATAGSFDMVKGAVAPEKPLSVQHWMDSLGTAMMFMPAIEAADKGVSSLLAGQRRNRSVMTKSPILWGTWYDYPKVHVNGQTYAKVGNRLYSGHAVDRMYPSMNRFGVNVNRFGGSYGRSITPDFVEYVISSTKGMKSKGNYLHTLGDVTVVLNKYDMVVSILMKHNG